MATVFALLVVLCGTTALLPGRSVAGATPVATVEAEKLTLVSGVTVIPDARASGRKALKFSGDVSATGSVTLGTAATSLVVRARGDQCNGAPNLVVVVDGAEVLNTFVSAPAWSEEATATVSLPAGNHVLSVGLKNSFVNTSGRKVICQRQLYVDLIRFSQEDTACATAQQPVIEGPFPIGVDVQPTSSFDKWKSLGVNTVVRVPQDHDSELWAKTAAAAGFRQIRAPHADPAADVGAEKLAWSHPDEPDGIYTQVPYSEIRQRYCEWKRLNPTVPVFINFVGKLNQYDIVTGESGDAWYRKYIDGADWVSGDIYPVNDLLSLSTIGQMVDRLRALSGARPVFAYIETADINPRSGGPAPSPDELRAEIWSAIIHGARGITYFPVQIDPFQFDATPPAVAEEMKKQNDRITALSAELLGEMNPAGVSASAPAPLEVGWRSASTGTFVIALNLSAVARADQQISVSGVSADSAFVEGEGRTVPIVKGAITDTFGPYAVHVYRIP